MKSLTTFTLILMTLFLVTLSGCLVVENPHTKLAPGIWRGVLNLDPVDDTRISSSSDIQRRRAIAMEEVTEGELPFLMEVIYTDEDNFYIVFINGEERIESHDIYYGLDRSTAKDTLRIQFPLMDTQIEAIHENGIMQGTWIVNYKENYEIPFEARFGQSHRFTTLKKEPVDNLTGRWAVTFDPNEENAYPGIAELKQDGNRLSGTIRTETGDYRYLDGSIQANKIYLSCFDGSHAFLFEGKLEDDGKIQGIFRSGSHYLVYWEATRNDAASLADPHQLTRPVSEDVPISFSFPDVNGKMVSNTDPEFQGRPLILQIMGTWCPNCLDESRFLKEWVEANPGSELQVLGIGFERYRDEAKSTAALNRYAERLELPYPLLFGGYYEKKEAATHLPFLSDIIAYPTMIFLDKQHKIVRIHTGFDGPATSKYLDFTNEFDNFVRQLTD